VFLRIGFNPTRSTSPCYKPKYALSGHTCVSCSHVLLSSDSCSSTDPACVFFSFKLYEGYNHSSLHKPSQLAVRVICRCHQTFVRHFDEVMSGSNVLYILYERTLQRITDMLISVNSSGDCVQEVVKRSVALFLHVFQS